MTSADSSATASIPSTDLGEADQLADGVTIWRYPDMCRQWGVSRATIERWVRQYDETGVGIPVHRDPSGRPYWLAHEASGMLDQPHLGQTGNVGDDRLAKLRRAARRQPQHSGQPR